MKLKSIIFLLALSCINISYSKELTHRVNNIEYFTHDDKEKFNYSCLLDNLNKINEEIINKTNKVIINQFLLKQNHETVSEFQKEPSIVYVKNNIKYIFNKKNPNEILISHGSFKNNNNLTWNVWDIKKLKINFYNCINKEKENKINKDKENNINKDKENNINKDKENNINKDKENNINKDKENNINKDKENNINKDKENNINKDKENNINKDKENKINEEKENKINEEKENKIINSEKQISFFERIELDLAILKAQQEIDKKNNKKEKKSLIIIDSLSEDLEEQVYVSEKEIEDYFVSPININSIKNNKGKDTNKKDNNQSNEIENKNITNKFKTKERTKEEEKIIKENINEIKSKNINTSEISKKHRICLLENTQKIVSQKYKDYSPQLEEDPNFRKYADQALLKALEICFK